MADYSVKVSNLIKKYNLYNSSSDRLKEILHIGKEIRHREYPALNDISFEVRKGETFGIIGTNGAGKSTLLKILTGITAPTSGTIEVTGKISALLELGTGFNMEYTGIENIYLNGIMLGFSREEMKGKVETIAEFADIGNFLYQPVKTYSSGMFARLAFAVAINVHPDILIVDEALSVGDVFFQNKCYRKFEELRSEGITVLFVSHDIATVKQMCSRVLWIEKGVQQMVGDSVEVCNAYSNSILAKRAAEYEKDNAAHEAQGGYLVEKFELEKYPDISYTNESIVSNEVQIKSVFITDTNGEMVSECNVNCRYCVNIIFSSSRAIKSCIAGFVLETIKGLWVINTNSIINGKETGFDVSENSMNRVEFHFTMPSIMNGDYVLGVAISEGNADSYKVLTWLYHVLYVRINNSARNSAVIDVPTDIKVFEYIGGDE
ncbi:MAG: ABC transporter ATP-binding protein [Lachnospiraceae bacterium]|nr:ABC transporter ATP-binding protein [Lachnospiraceae bacterium]